MKILSIDAWREPCYPSGYNWTWNNWFHVGDITKEDFEKLDTNRKLLKYFRDEGYITSGSTGKVTVEDDQHNLVIVSKGTREPLFAIEYGPEY